MSTHVRGAASVATSSSKPTDPPPARRSHPLVLGARNAIGLVVAVAAVWWLLGVADWTLVANSVKALTSTPWTFALALSAYAVAFLIRARAWTALQPAVPLRQALAAIHVGLAANHVLPMRMGEVFRVTSASRRTKETMRDTAIVTASLRLGDMLALLIVGAVAAPAALLAVVPPVVAAAVSVVSLAAIVGLWTLGRSKTASAVSPVTLVAVAFATAVAWVLEAGVLFAVAQAAGVNISFFQAVGVTAVTVLAQAIAVTPGGFGTYEAAGTAGLAVLGVAAPEAFAVVFATHAVKTAYALVTGSLALFVPSPTYWGRFRLPAQLPPRPVKSVPKADAPVVVFMPAYNEAEVIGNVIRRIPQVVHGRAVRVLVIDDGSTDDTAQIASEAGATVLAQPRNIGLGSAVRRGLREAAALGAAAGVYLDADDEYRPEDIAAVVEPVLAGELDYVIGSRFSGTIEHMHSHRRVGNLTLTQWVKWLTRRPDLTDGQSGFRAFSSEALASGEVIHDYNYAQVLTLDLLGKGFVYGEVPIGYAFRTTGKSFISLGTYLRRVIPAVHKELNKPN